MDPRKNEERVVNAFETGVEKNVKNTMAVRITKDEIFQRAKEGRLLLKVLGNRRHSWIGQTIRHNE